MEHIGKVHKFGNTNDALTWLGDQIPSLSRTSAARILAKCELDNWTDWHQYERFAIRRHGGNYEITRISKVG